ncbi:MAG: hypothetical protein MUE81_18105, partial [Thermoflexibacter sp.]|nr:hypothetical protein [Thermoflexibacter sp.]
IVNKQTHEAVEVIIKAIDFMGAFYRLEVILPNQREMILYTPLVDNQKGEQIFITLDRQKLLIF